jgi:N-acyl amino acid synthase of PEP-CTERM/exosortase system
MNTRTQSFAESFLTYFDISFAGTPAQLEHVARIRYRVYCEEFGYEAGEAFPDDMERDDFDSHSLHCLVTHKASNTPAGCVRVVRPPGKSALPFEKFCSSSLDSDFFEANPMPRETMCEVSRLAVDGMFRRRSGEKATRFGGVHVSELSQQEQRSFPLIAVSCFLAANIMADLPGRTNLFAMMEPFLPRLLKRSGIQFSRVGEDIDYHGLRAPYFVTTSAVKDGVVSGLSDGHTGPGLKVGRTAIMLLPRSFSGPKYLVV